MGSPLVLLDSNITSHFILPDITYVALNDLEVFDGHVALADLDGRVDLGLASRFLALLTLLALSCYPC